MYSAHIRNSPHHPLSKVNFKYKKWGFDKKTVDHGYIFFSKVEKSLFIQRPKPYHGWTFNLFCNHSILFTQIPLYIMKELIAEYVNDHFQHFGFYPYDVEVDGIVLSYSEYQKILTESN